MKQLMTPIYMIIQSVFVIYQYQIAKLYFGSEGLNNLILILSASIPFQLFNMGIGHYIYSNSEKKLGTEIQAEGIKTVMVLSAIGLLIVLALVRYLEIRLGANFIIFGIAFLFFTNLNNFLFLLYDGGGYSYLRSLIAGAVSLLFLGISFFSKDASIHPITWFAGSAFLVTIFLIRPLVPNLYRGYFNPLQLIKNGLQYNIMMLPSLSYDFIIKAVLSSLNPVFLPFFDLINKLIQQINSLIVMMNQALAQIIKRSDKKLIAKISLISAGMYLIMCSAIHEILPLILDYIGLEEISGTSFIFGVIALGWLFNTISASWYFDNIFSNRVSRNTAGNTVILIFLLMFGGIGIFIKIPIYFIWALALISGAIVTIGLKNIVFLFREAPLCWMAIGVASVLIPLFSTLTTLIFITATCCYIIATQLRSVYKIMGETNDEHKS